MTGPENAPPLYGLTYRPPGVWVTDQTDRDGLGPQTVEPEDEDPQSLAGEYTDDGWEE